MTSVVLLASKVEILLRLRQWVTYVVVTGMATLAWFSVQLGANELSARRETYRAQLAELAHRQVLPAVPLVGWAEEPILRVVRPPELGSVIARGEDLSVPAYFDFGPAGVVWARNVASDNAQMQGGTLLDLESIVRVLGGFLALLLGFQCFAGPGARRSMRSWEALGVGTVPAVLGRLLGCCGLVTACSIVVVGAATIGATISLPEETRDLMVLFARFLVPVTLYLCCFAAIGSVFAVWGRNQAGALAAGIALWIVAAMVWPQVVTMGAQIRAPSMSRLAMEIQRDRAFGDEVRNGEEALGDAVARWISSMPATDAVMAIGQHRTELDLLWRDSGKVAKAAANAIEERWRSDRDREERLERLAYLSPGTPLLRSVSALVSTGRELSRQWDVAVEAQQARLAGVLFDDWSQVTVRVPSQDSRRRLRFDRHPGLRWQAAPAFQEPKVDSAGLWKAAIRPLLVLLAYLCSAGVLVAVGAPRLLR